MLYVDIHTHNREVEERTVKIVNLNTDEANTYLPTENLYSIGIHPWRIENNFSAELHLLDDYSYNPKFVSIGEIGIDKTSSKPIDIQTQVFKDQANIAHKLGKPIIIHCVKALSEILEIKKNGYKDDIWIMHGFQGGFETADQLIKHNIYISFGKHLLTKAKTIEAFRKVDMSKIFLETDDSDISIKELYKEAAIIKDVKPTIIRKQIASNFNNIFPLDAV